MEIQLYIANLGKYNEGFLVGEWFTLPIDYKEVKETIGLNEEYEEYAIHDFEAPFKISEYTSLSYLNEIAEAMADCAEEECKALCLAVDYGHATDFLDALKQYQDGSLSFHFYNDCKDMSDVAYHVIEEMNLLDTSSTLARYFDYDAYGRDLEIEGSFVQLDYDTYIEFIF